MSPAARVGLVFVSHSAKIAEGIVDLTAQMAADIALLPAGGTAAGGIGTDFARVSDAIQAAESGAGVLVLCDLGSAVLTAETALDFLDEEQRARVLISPAPLVEGAVAAAVAAQIGRTLADVAAAALTALSVVDSAPGSAPALGEVAPPLGGDYRRRVVIVNRDGLHARPAAEFSKLASTFPVRVLVNGRDAKSLLLVMSLGLLPGMEAEISSSDPEGRRAVDALADLIEDGFGER